MVQITVERCLKSVVPHPGVRPGLFNVCKNLWIEEIRRRNSRGTDHLTGGTVDLIATFRTADHWCREYVTESTRAAACYVNGNWKTMASEPTTEDNASRNAGNGSSKVESFVIKNMIGNPLHPNAERVMLRTLD